MPFLDLASIAVASIILFLSTLSQVALWQQKEYRWDRMKSHLKSPQGSPLNHPLVLLAIAAIFIGWIAYLISFLPLTKGEWPLKAAEGAGLVTLLLFLLHHAGRIKTRGVLRPDFTLKALTIIFLTLLSQFYILYSIFYIQELPALQLATFIFFLPGFLTVAVALANVIFNIRKRQIIAEAKRLRSAQTNLTVVGITGSYGKTSTKHFLEQILKSSGKNIAATREHHNTPIGVSQDILTLLPSKPDIFIAELSAYIMGEIRELTDIIQPKIGVITAIGNQHIDLFGSQENILAAKWELVENLPKNGLAVLNADDARLKQKKYQNMTWYSAKRHADIWVEHVNIQPAYITCTLHLNNFTQATKLPLASEALLSSALAAAAACLALRISPREIMTGLEKLKPFPRTMEILEGKNGAIIIDDSYSANEHGTLLAIRHLGRFPQPDKRIVFLPFLELGREKKAAEQRVQEAVRAARAKLFIYENQNPKKFAQEVSQDISDKTAILLEGRVPDVVRESVI